MSAAGEERGASEERVDLAWTSRLLGSSTPPPSAPPSSQLVERLRTWRLAPEVAASPRLGELPREARRALGVERARCAAAAAVRAETLERLGAALSRADATGFLYKGEAVVRLTHGDASRREMADVDVVVSPARRRAVREALVGAGFLGVGCDTPLHDVLVDRQARGPGHPHGVAVEVHADVFPPPHPFRLELERVAERARPSDVAGLSVPTAADALWLAAFHALLYELDASKLLLELRDVALLAEAMDDADLEDARAEAERRDLGSVLAEVAARAVRWAGAPATLAADGRLASPRAGTARRRLAVALAVRGLDRGIGAPRGVSRSATRHLAAALWHRSPFASTLALVRGALGRPGRARRMGRYLRSFVAAGRPSVGGEKGRR